MFGATTVRRPREPGFKRRALARARKVVDRAQLITSLCEKYGISRTEYEERFRDWRKLRRTCEEIRDFDEWKRFQEEVRFALKDRAADRASRRAAKEAQRVLDIFEAKEKSTLNAVFPKSACKKI